MKYVIGLDVGGTKIHSIVAEWDKDFLNTRRLPKIVKSRRKIIQNKKNESKFFQEIVEEINLLLGELGRENVARVGVGIAGPLNKDKVTSNPPNIPLKNFPILSEFKKSFDLPVYVDNDANCFAWAEHIFGAAAAASSSVGITLGTGVGGGIVIDCNGESVLWDGYNGSAAEIGHMILDGKDSLESRKYSFEELCSSKARHLWGKSDPLTIEREARNGNKKSQELYKEFGYWLGIGIANIVNIMDPEMVVVGGSLSNAWDLFEEEMLSTSNKYIISTQAKKTKIVRAKLGDDAGALGAAYLI